MACTSTGLCPVKLDCIFPQNIKLEYILKKQFRKN